MTEQDLPCPADVLTGMDGLFAGGEGRSQSGELLRGSFILEREAEDVAALTVKVVAAATDQTKVLDTFIDVVAVFPQIVQNAVQTG